MKTLALILCAAALGCGSTVSVGNDNPKGTVGGIVLDAETEMPIMGAMITIVSASATVQTTSDAMGVWQAKDVPAGTFILSIAMSNYITAQFNATLAGAVGNFPVNNPALTVGPTGLVKNSGTFSVRLVDQGGSPVAGVSVIARPQVRFVDLSTAFKQSIGDYNVQATSGMDGVAKFTGLPDYAGLGGVVSDILPIDVAPTKVMGTDVYDFLGLTQTYQVNHLTDPTPTIVLAGPKTTLAVLTSNVDYFRTGTVGPTGSIVPVNGPISVAFNQAISPTSVKVTFQTDTGMLAPFTAMATVQGNVVTIMPSAGFTPGMRYNVQLHAEAAQALIAPGGGQFDSNAPFFAQQTAGVNPSTVAAHIDQTSPPGTPFLIITLNEAIGLGGAFGAGYSLSCVAYYEGVNFDNDSVNNYQGEWPSTNNPAQVTCPSTPGPATVNVTQVTEIEPAGPATGFSSKWKLQYDGPGNGPCSTSLMTCGPTQRPVLGTKVHLVFSHQTSPSLTVHRVNGDAVGDDIVATIAN
jgi:hypothetical protein